MYEASQGETETVLSNIWMQLLNINRVGRHDSFFILGGHSLLAVRMISRVHAVLGFRSSMGALFKAPTIAELGTQMLGAIDKKDASFDV